MNTLLIVILLALATLITAFFTERGYTGLATTIILGAGASTAWFLEVPVFEYTLEHWPKILWFLGLYVLFGVLWSFIKMWRTAILVRTKVRAYLKEHPLPDLDNPWRDVRKARRFAIITEEEEEEEEDDNDALFNKEPDDRFFRWAKQAPTHFGGYKVTFEMSPEGLKVSLKAGDHKMIIISWMALWPFSMLGTLIADFLIHLWESIYKVLSSLYQRISDKVLGNL